MAGPELGLFPGTDFVADPADRAPPIRRSPRSPRNADQTSPRGRADDRGARSSSRARPPARRQAGPLLDELASPVPRPARRTSSARRTARRFRARARRTRSVSGSGDREPHLASARGRVADRQSPPAAPAGRAGACGSTSCSSSGWSRLRPCPASRRAMSSSSPSPVGRPKVSCTRRRGAAAVSVSSTSAVRFVGRHRPSIAIENDVSTTRRTASFGPRSPGPPRRRSHAAGPSVAARPRTPLSDLRLPSHGSVSRTAAGLVTPEGSPAAPARELALRPAGRHPLGDVARTTCRLAHRLRARPRRRRCRAAGSRCRAAPARAAGGLASTAPGRRDGGRAAQVDLVQPGAQDSDCSASSSSSAMSCSTPVPSPTSPSPLELLPTAPVLARRDARGGRPFARASPSTRTSRTPAATASSAPRAAPPSSSSASVERPPSAGERVEQLVDVPGVLGKKSRTWRRIRRSPPGCPRPAGPSPALVQVGEHRVDRGAVLVRRVLQRLLRAASAGPAPRDQQYLICS